MDILTSSGQGTIAPPVTCAEFAATAGGDSSELVKFQILTVYLPYVNSVIKQRPFWYQNRQLQDIKPC